ncbi:hypothetical protein YC2023_070644 [Brassica napus]
MEELFVPGDIALLNHHQLVVSDKDSWFWKHTRSGIYSVKRGYDLALLIKNHSLINEQSPTPSINPLKAKVWSIKAPSKIKVFISKALSNALTFNDSLRDRGMKCDEVFQICGMAGEYINHLLFVCSLARQILAISGFPSPAGGFHNCSLFVNLNHLNSLLFDGFLFDGLQTWKKAKEESGLCLFARSAENREEDMRSVSVWSKRES